MRPGRDGRPTSRRAAVALFVVGRHEADGRDLVGLANLEARFVRDRALWTLSGAVGVLAGVRSSW